MNDLQATPGNYSDLLFALTESGLPYFIEGGQAVNIWAEYFSDSVPELDSFAPFTSKDCDIWVGKETLNRLTTVLDGTLKRASDPAEVQVGVFLPRQDPDKKLELFGHVHGIPLNEFEKVRRSVMEIGGYRVMQPIFLFKAKCHNLVKLDQRGRQDRRHVQIMQRILPAFFTFSIQFCVAGELPERVLLKNIKYLRSLKNDKTVRLAMEEIGGDWDDLIPIEDLRSAELPKLNRYAASEWGNSNKSD